jgi:hypothetical protein
MHSCGFECKFPQNKHGIANCTTISQLHTANLHNATQQWNEWQLWTESRRFLLSIAEEYYRVTFVVVAKAHYLACDKCISFYTCSHTYLLSDLQRRYTTNSTSRRYTLPGQTLYSNGHGNLFFNCPTRCNLFSLLYISVGSSTCFGCWHPSSEARTTGITASGTGQPDLLPSALVD